MRAVSYDRRKGYKMKYLAKNILQPTIFASGLLLLSACGDNNLTSEATSITHNGTTYSFVTSPYTGKVWLNKNLGAAEVCAGFDDAQCYGDYYQWGRGYDGHQESDSGTTNVQTSNVTEVGHGDFITSTSIKDLDWAKDVDGSGGRRIANWSKIDGSSVCPVGFRVPTLTELKAETLENGVTNRDTAFTNFLALPSAGYSTISAGSLNDVGLWGGVWISSVGGSGSYGLLFAESYANTSSSARAYGLSVRCLRD